MILAPSQVTYIYGLIDPVTKHIRYVGKANDPYKRFLNHLYTSSTEDTYKSRWITSLVKKNLKPELKILACINLGE